MSRAIDIFRTHVKKDSWIAPEAIEYGFIFPTEIGHKATHKIVYELSTGKFLGVDVYGVTVLKEDEKHKGKIDEDLSKPFFAMKEARHYITEMQIKFNQ